MRKDKNATDEELITAYRQGEFEAVEILCERYRNLVNTISAHFYIKGSEQQDVIQEGMIGLFKAIQNFDETKEVPFKEFAKICITRQIQKAIESADTLKNRPLNSYVSLTDEEQSVDENAIADTIVEHAPESALLDSETTNAFYDRLADSLSKMELQVLHYMMQGYDYRTIAAHMNKSEKNIDNAIQRIRKKAKKFT